MSNVKKKTLNKSASDINLEQYGEITRKKKWKKITNNAKFKPQSRLSKSMERSLPHEEESNKDLSIRSDNDLLIVKTINMTVCLVIGNTVQSCCLRLNPEFLVEKIIELAIKGFNEQFESNHTLFRLIPDKTKYRLKPSKKTGFPKLDMPCFEVSARVGNINTTQMTLVWKESPQNYKIYFCKKNEIVEKKKICQDCIVF